MKKADLIFVPSPGAGHLVSAIEFSKRLIARDARFSITILTMNWPFPTGTSTNQNKPTSTQSVPSEPTSMGLQFISLPQVKPPPPEVLAESIEEFVSIYASSHGPHVKDAIASLHNSSTGPLHVAGLVVDMFCTSIIDVADELGIPSYVFFTSSAAFLGLVLDLPARYDRVGVAMFNESEPETVVPSFQNPVPTWALPTFAFTKGCTTFINHGRRFKETKGLIINTFAELEPYAVNSLSGGSQTVPVYTVGPVLDLEGQVQRLCDPDQRARIMTWLDLQPESSVVFLCFGSVGSFNEDQMREIAKGISQSGQRFLWSVRKAPSGAAKRPTEYTDMQEVKSILPDNFLALVEEGRGLICGWAPQVDILAHKGIGSFVSHCGWNSTLEALWFGKPIVAWPLYAEQHTNAFELVSELKLAVTNLGYRAAGDLVTANEVEIAIRSLMDKENPVRTRVKEMAEISKSSLMEGGSSFNSVGCLIRDIMGNQL